MKRRQIKGNMLENFWQTERVVQDIWSYFTYSDTPFAFLLQVFEALFTWATISGITLNRGKGFDHE
jgi:hypothetical protein